MPTKPSSRSKKPVRRVTEQTDEDNVVRQEQAKGTVRPDGPGDATAPVKPDRRARR